MGTAGLFEVVEAVLAAAGLDLASLLRAWARLLPTLLIVPIFGGAALPGPARAGLGIALAVSAAPALGPGVPATGPLALQLLSELAIGIPPALGAAALFYAAIMAGGAIDDLRAARETSTLPPLSGQPSPMGALLGLPAVIVFLQTGGASRIVESLVSLTPGAPLMASTVALLLSSVSIAVAVAAPVAVAAIVLGVAEGLIARAALPAHVTALLAPLRGVVLLAMTALLLDRILEALTQSFP